MIPGPGAVWPPDPRDKLHPVFSRLWVQILTEAITVEIIALLVEARMKHAGTSDRKKRTFSAFWRYLFATDSVTGIPVDVPAGRLRRFLGGLFLWWFTRHTTREGDV